MENPAIQLKDKTRNWPDNVMGVHGACQQDIGQINKRSGL